MMPFDNRDYFVIAGMVVVCTMLWQIKSEMKYRHCQEENKRLKSNGQEHELLHGIGDSCLTASSSWPSSFKWGTHGPENSRLHNQPNIGSHIGAWQADRDNFTQYIQADLVREYYITKVAIQGRPMHFNQWVTRFRLGFMTSLNDDFNMLKNTDGDEIEFGGSYDRDTVIEHVLPFEVKARFVRLYPRGCNEHISMRWGLYGTPAIKHN